MGFINKRGVFFSIDALIALSIILLGTLIVIPTLGSVEHESFIHKDLVATLSTVKINEIDNSYAKSLISQGLIDDPNKSVLEQLGEFFVFNETIARNLANSILSGVNVSENFGLWFGDKLVASRNDSTFSGASNIVTERQVISGIKEGGSVTAFSGRAFLSNNLKNDYFYFGGYVGEGNISALIEYEGNISSAVMELAIPKDFEVYINGNYSGSFTGTGSGYIPFTYELPIGNFNSGINTIEIKGNNLNIGGGFIKISYQESFNSTYVNGLTTINEKRYLPGIDGIINLYDAVRFSGKLNSLEVYLNFVSNYTAFVNFGGVTIFNGTSTTGILFDDTYLSSLLDYSSFSNDTVPFRMGLENASYLTNYTKPADVFSVVDLSGSMAAGCTGGSFWCCLFNGWCSTPLTCASCGGTYEDKIGLAKNASEAFIDSVLNNSENRVGLVGYRDTAGPADFHSLSTSEDSLKTEVSSWTASGATCICCGINKATSELASYSTSEKFRSMVVMSDGEANGVCSEQGNGDAKQDAIDAACDAYNNQGIKVYAVGFGDGADESTLQSIANCGNGSYYYSDVNELVEIYEEIAQEIIEASYYEQTLSVVGNLSSVIFPDSYISYNYDYTGDPFGLVTTTEKRFDNEFGGAFSLPPNSSIVDAVAISYSGPRWTDSVLINGNTAFNLSVYGSDFTDLGDPYSVGIQNGYILQDNIVNVTTGLGPENSSSGSTYNKIIYTVVQNNSAAYSSISSAAEGCNWLLEFEDLSNSTLKSPEDYSGSENCYYISSGQNVSNNNDALQLAVYRLLELLDYDSDGKIDVKFNSQDLQISSSEIVGIPFDWSTEMQVRVWY